MADYFGAAEDLISGVGNFMGSQASAAGAQTAANSYAQAARLSQASTNIKQAMVDRQLYQTLGGMKASAAASGLGGGGSVTDLIRDSARQGAITKAVVGLQGNIDYNSLMAESNASAAQAKATKSGGFLGALGSVVGVVGSLFSDDDLKDDVMLVRRRPDGIGVYKFRYKGSTQFFEGAMASDVEKVRPDALGFDLDTGHRYVDYDALRLELRMV